MASIDFSKSLNDEEGALIFRDWFLLSSERRDIPLRSGYAAGYELVALLSQRSSIEEMVSWTMADVKNKIEAYALDLIV